MEGGGEGNLRILFDVNEFHVRPPTKVGPQPLVLPPTRSLAPEPTEKKEAVRLCEGLRDDVVLGYVKQSDVGESLLELRPVTWLELKKGIINPHVVDVDKGCLVQVLGGKLYPFKLPIISDLALHPKAFKVFILRELETSDNDYTRRIISLLMKETATELPMRRESYTIGKGISKVVLQSSGNYFKAVDVDVSISSMLRVGGTITQNTSDHRDGQSHELSMEVIRSLGVRDLKRKRVVDVNMKTVLIWNCRGVASGGFTTAFEPILDCHLPSYVVLLETRVPKFVVQKVMKTFGMKVVASIAPIGGTGGVAVVTKNQRKWKVRARDIEIGRWECMLPLQ